MKLVKRNNYHTAFNSFFDDFFAKDLFSPESEVPFKGTVPSVNIINNDESFVIEVAAPGMKKEDFNLELDNNLLSISYEKKEEKESSGKYTRREFSYESFKRTFTIPENVVNGEAIQAKYEDGILRLHLPKKEEAKVQPKRAIEIG
jgi:HSP20 family protein